MANIKQILGFGSDNDDYEEDDNIFCSLSCVSLLQFSGGEAFVICGQEEFLSDRDAVQNSCEFLL